LSDEELEALRRKRLLELQRRLLEEERKAQIQREIELQRRAVLRHILTPEARRRLTNLRMVKPEFVVNLENQLIQLAQQGAIKVPITDAQLKTILARLSSRHREPKIRRV